MMGTHLTIFMDIITEERSRTSLSSSTIPILKISLPENEETDIKPNALKLKLLTPEAI
ncbi:MAG: hypothetical protein ACFFDT_17350 [Candidatus Hodarchaeota archaeon]